MKRDLKALADERFDLLVVGGGILGAGVARDAVLRGWRVALVDQGDFASGTSSRSTKLIHGGFRYLEQGAVKLVTESCRERAILQQIAPHLVKPLSFVFAVYDGDARPLWKIRLGLTLYDLLARYRNPGRHQTLASAAALREVEPALNPIGLRGGVVFYDCAEDDARFCIDNIFHAATLGAVCANYCEVTGFVTAKGGARSPTAFPDRIAAARVVDRLRSETFEIRAAAFVNAAGPWVSAVTGLTPWNGTRVLLSPTKGVHLLVPRLTNAHGVFFQSRQDGRIIFIVPWLDCSLIGSTDIDYAGDPLAVAADDKDIAYLLAEARQLMPDARLDESRIITTFAGVRPLLRSTGRPSERTREHRLIQHGANFLSVAGGKYTTYRAIAEQVTDKLCECLRSVPSCRTSTTPLPNHRPEPAGEKLADIPEVWASDVRYACDHEMAHTLSDVMRRRTPLALSRYGGEETARLVAREMVAALGWDETELGRQVGDYLAARKRGTL